MIKDKEYRCKCGCNKLYVVNKRDCGECKHNGIYVDESNYEKITKLLPGADVGEFVHLETLPEGEYRTQVEYDLCCELGEGSNGDGCFIFTCSECGKIVEMLPANVS